MNINRILKPGLFVYECIRIIIFAIIVMSQRDGVSLLTVIYASSAVLFPLMALFICLDTERYKAYLPLFIAGKSIGIFLELGWSIITQQGKILIGSQGSAFFAQLILSGDLFALAAVLFIVKGINKQAEIQAAEEEK